MNKEGETVYYLQELHELGITDEYSSNMDVFVRKNRKLQINDGKNGNPMVTYEDICEKLKERNCHLNNKEEFERFYHFFMQSVFGPKFMKFIKSVDDNNNSKDAIVLDLNSWLNF